MLFIIDAYDLVGAGSAPAQASIGPAAHAVAGIVDSAARKPLTA
jgi:hypothetical protein